MSLLTPLLKLFKWDTTNETDLKSEFDIDTSMNDNWDKIDNFAGQANNAVIDIQDDIENIQTKNTQQDELIQKLQNNTIQESTEEETILHVKDASDLPAVLNISGNHYQEQQEGTSNLAILQEGTIEKDGNKIIVENGIATLSGRNSSDATNYIKVGTAYLYKGKKYYINNIRNLTAGSHGALLRGSTTKWFTANTELEWECPETMEWSIEITYSSGQYATGTDKFLISETSKATWVQGKRTIPSVEYPSEIETVKDNIKIIQCNKNFFNVNSKNIGGVDLTLQEDGKYKINGNATSSWTFREGEKTLLEKGDYTLSVEVESGTFNGFFGIRGSDNIKYETKGEVHISLTEDKLITCYFTCSGTATFDNVVVKVQLEKSKVKTEFVKHEEKIYNLAVQQEMLKNDYFNLENNKEVHGWKKYTVTSVDDFKVTKKETRFEFEMSVVSGNHLSNLVCNMFKKWRTSDYTKTACYIAWNSKFIILLQFGDCGFTESMTVEEAKTRFQEIINENTSLIFYYSMITTEELDLTEEQKETLSQLQNLELFKGVNNIYTEQDLALLQLNYTADTKMYIDNKIASQNKEILNVAGGN